MEQQTQPNAERGLDQQKSNIIYLTTNDSGEMGLLIQEDPSSPVFLLFH